MLKKEYAQMHFGLVIGMTRWPWQTDTNGNFSPITVKGIFLVGVDLHPLPFITIILNTVRDTYHTFSSSDGVLVGKSFLLGNTGSWCLFCLL